MDRDELPCCNFNCNQGRFCLRRKEAAEACTELGADTKLPPTPPSRWWHYLIDFALALALTAGIMAVIYAMGMFWRR